MVFWSTKTQITSIANARIRALLNDFITQYMPRLVKITHKGAPIMALVEYGGCATKVPATG